MGLFWPVAAVCMEGSNCASYDCMALPDRRFGDAQGKTA